MKQSQLNELIRFITRSVMKEYISMSSSSQSSSSTSSPDSTQDPNTPPQDAMTSAEKSKQRRDSEKSRQQSIKKTDLELKAAKSQTDYFNQQNKQNKLQISAKQRELQNLKAGKTIGSGGAGSIS
jgi:hypothetical protein